MGTRRRTNAAAATRWLRRAETLARRVVPTYGSKREVIDGYLLRGSKAQDDLVAEVLDLPAYVLLAGFARLRPGISFGFAAGAVGTRDDLRPPARHEGWELPDQNLYLILPLVLFDFVGQFSSVDMPAVQQSGALLGIGAAQFEYAAPPPEVNEYFLDDMAYFTSAQGAMVGCALTSVHRAGATLSFVDGEPAVSGVRDVYLAKAHMRVMESDLPDGWLLHPRRLVPYASYSGTDPYRTRASPGTTMPGFHVEPSEDPEVPDKFCLAFRAFRQSQDTWYVVPPETVGRRLYYERRGEERLHIHRGELLRSDFEPGQPARAATTSVRTVGVEAVPQAAMLPVPATLPANDWGRPELPNSPRWLNPYVTPTPEGEVVWCVYTSDNGPDELPAGAAYALAAILPNDDCVMLRMDRDVDDGYPRPPTAEVGELVVPWIVGAESCGEVACCLVWEHVYARRGTADPRGRGGRLVLYRSDGLEVSRTVLSTTLKALFAATMQWGPTVFDSYRYDADTESPFSNMVRLDDNTLAFVGTTAVGTPATASSVTVPENIVSLATIDVTTGAVTVLSQLLPRTLIYRKCLLSVVSRAKGDKPAVILAAVTDAIRTSRSNGTTLISHDGGVTWGRLTEGLGGQGGSIYAGNLLWEHDVDQQRYWS